MSDQIIIAAAALVAIGIIALAALRGWQGWLALKERELERGAHPQREIEGGAPIGAARIEIADLKERIRKLEAIASGVDL
ncbi:hypothetical protein [Altererythrobacter sp. C41]|uniref:hypothetical protein n=1 Tax=Altererythrobacter sp. C41 TaxID=2806021 RepID=UPI001933BCE3|nr:hypothetical protein [Altererythrobacter sp. C41]MBM0169952.1 hypothetical protein [Altererythrobacter sp. C41]